MKNRRYRFLASRAPRPFVAFAATSEKQAEKLYRSQNLIWAWIGIASIISAITYFSRPDLGPTIVTHSEFLDIVRQLIFAIGGAAIATGVWTIRRSIEFGGHIFFTTGALMNVFASLMVHNTVGGHFLGTITLLGIAASSGFRALFILEWIGADSYAAHDDHDSDAG